MAVKAQAVSLAPVDTGRLRSSIGYKTPTKTEGDLTVSPRKNEAYVGTNVEYAGHVEFGTRRAAAQPYLRPAAGVLKGEGEVRRILNRNMAEYLKRVGR